MEIRQKQWKRVKKRKRRKRDGLKETGKRKISKCITSRILFTTHPLPSCSLLTVLPCLVLYILLWQGAGKQKCSVVNQPGVN